MIHRKSWQGLEKVEWATLTWVDGFNPRRLLEPMGYIPPAEAEAAYYSVPKSVVKFPRLGQGGVARSAGVVRNGGSTTQGGTLYRRLTESAMAA